MRPVSGWEGRVLAALVPAIALAGCAGAAPSLSTADPVHDLITIDQLVEPGFTVTSPSAHVAATTLWRRRCRADIRARRQRVAIRRDCRVSTRRRFQHQQRADRHCGHRRAPCCRQRSVKRLRGHRARSSTLFRCRADVDGTPRRRGAFDQRRPHDVGRSGGENPPSSGRVGNLNQHHASRVTSRRHIAPLVLTRHANRCSNGATHAAGDSTSFSAAPSETARSTAAQHPLPTPP